MLSPLAEKIVKACRLHAILSFLVGLAVYTQQFKEIVSLLGVPSESPHALRNTGFLLLLISFISYAVFFQPLRTLCGKLGSVLGFSADNSQGFAAGLAVLSNSLLLLHYTAEAFVYHAVSKTVVAVLLVVTICCAAGLNIRIDVIPDAKKGN